MANINRKSDKELKVLKNPSQFARGNTEFNISRIDEESSGDDGRESSL